MQLTEVRIAGFGGQGVILAAMILGKAAIEQGAYATLTQSFGPEARGGASSAGVILSDAPIHYPYVTRPDVLVALSQPAYDRFVPQLEEDGIVIVERDLVRVAGLGSRVRVFSLPATRIAEELGRRMVMNVVTVGFLSAVAGLLDRDALRRAITESVNEASRELNLRAFERGFEQGIGAREAASDPAAQETDVALVDGEA